ncbi:hypothetical protein LINPERHAP1_LOCUS8185, partial [Linum perenne]
PIAQLFSGLFLHSLLNVCFQSRQSALRLFQPSSPFSIVPVRRIPFVRDAKKVKMLIQECRRGLLIQEC